MKDTKIKRLRKGSRTPRTDGVLQRGNIHIAVGPPGEVGATLASLRGSPRITSAKGKFVLATDGAALEAEDLACGETIASEYRDFARHFNFFSPLAGISTLAKIKNNAVDIKATTGGVLRFRPMGCPSGNLIRVGESARG